MRRHQLFLDFQDRPFASVLLSKKDTKNLSLGLFGSPRQGECDAGPGVTLAADDADQLAQLAERLQALDSIRSSRTWRWLGRIRNRRIFWGAAGWLRSGGDSLSCSFPELGEGDRETRVLRIESDGDPILWDFIGRDGGCELRPDPEGAFGQALVATRAGARCWWSSYGGQQRVVLAGGPGLGSVSRRRPPRRPRRRTLAPLSRASAC